MKKPVRITITNPERNARRVLRLTMETVRLLDPEALARAISGCNSTSNPTDAPMNTKGC